MHSLTLAVLHCVKGCGSVVGFRWPRDPIKVLGIFFSCDLYKASELNFIEKIQKLEKTLNSWMRGNVTLLGKINVIKK